LKEKEGTTKPKTDVIVLVNERGGEAPRRQKRLSSAPGLAKNPQLRTGVLKEGSDFRANKNGEKKQRKKNSERNKNRRKKLERANQGGSGFKGKSKLNLYYTYSAYNQTKGEERRLGAGNESRIPMDKGGQTDGNTGGR